MPGLNAVQKRNFAAALAVAKTDAERDRLAFAIWSESAGFIYANDGSNTSNSPGVTPAVKAILRRSLNLPHDKVGSNGRSTGILQQISAEAGGGWGDLSGTMDPAESARRFLRALNVTGVSQYVGTLVTPTGTRRVVVNLSSPIAADVLRVQQPLADEAESSNYGPAAVKAAQEISAMFKPKQAQTQGDWFMAQNWDEAKAEVERMLTEKVGEITRYIEDGVVFRIERLAEKVDWLKNADTISGQPFSRTETSFNDIRNLSAKVDALTELVKSLKVEAK